MSVYNYFMHMIIVLCDTRELLCPVIIALKYIILYVQLDSPGDNEWNIDVALG